MSDAPVIPKGAEALYNAFGLPLPPQTGGQGVPRETPQPGPQNQAKTGALKALFAELERVEKHLCAPSPPGSKPADLAGKFRYAESVVKGAGTRLTSLDVKPGEDPAGIKENIIDKTKLVARALADSRQRNIDASLSQLQSVVSEAKGKVDHIQGEANKAEQLTGPKQKRARSDLYVSASEELTELVRQIDDWSGQVDEAKTFLGENQKDFKAALTELEQFERTLSAVVESCLPKLTSRLPREGEAGKDVSGGTAVPEIPKDGELAALKACGMSWVNAKQKYGANKDQMQKLADFRKREVDAWLKENLTKWGLENGAGKGWVSVGSADPTSDYDISVNKHGKDKDGNPKFDHELVTDFNKWFRGKFGGEGGTVFDTNLYASAGPLVTDPKAEGDPAKSTNDIAALMKMRRYMSAGEFETFRVETVEACGDDGAQSLKVQTQFAMADSNYRIVITQLLENGRATLEQRVAEQAKQLVELNKKLQEAGDDETAKDKINDQILDLRLVHDLENAGIHDIDAWLQKSASAKGGLDTVGLTEEGEELSRTVDHLLKDAALQNTNEMYTAKVGEVRNHEQVILALEDLKKAINGEVGRDKLIAALASTKERLGKIMRVMSKSGEKLTFKSGAVDAAIKALESNEEGALGKALDDLRKNLESELGTRFEQLNNLNVISRYFANEAYQADGPFAHVVTATQAAEVDATNETVAEHTKKLSDKDRKDKDAKTQIAIALEGGIGWWDTANEDEKKAALAKAQKLLDDAIAKKKKERQGELSNDECLQSFNEQLGDFLKDLEHYGAEEPGKAIIQSSKYLERLLDAVRLMHDKEMFKGATNVLGKIEGQLALQGRVKKELIAARKGNLMLVPEEGGPGGVDQQEQRRAYACQFMKDLGITSVAALAKRYAQFGVEVNAAARKALAKG